MTNADFQFLTVGILFSVYVVRGIYVMLCEVFDDNLNLNPGWYTIRRGVFWPFYMLCRR